jgi:hypothetical protein
MASKKKGTRTTRVSRDTREWLEHHTIEDLKELACEMYSDGEDVSELVEVVNKLEQIEEHELGIHEDLMMPMPDGSRKKIEA